MTKNIRSLMLCLFPIIWLAAALPHAQAQKTILDSLIAQHASLRGDSRAYNALKISKYALNQDSAQLFAREATRMAVHDTTKVLAWNQYAWILKNMREMDSARWYVRQVIPLAKRIGFQAGESDLYITLGSIYYNSAVYDTALQFQAKALDILSELEDDEGVASILNNMSIVYQKTGEYEKSKEVLIRSRGIREKQNRIKEIGDTYLNLGNVYYYMGDLDSCIFAFTEALRIYEAEQLPNFQSYALANLAYIYDSELKDAAKAKVYFLKILKIESELNNYNLITSAMDGLGTYYANQKQYDSALYYHESVLERALEKENKQQIAATYNNLAGVYLDQRQYERARGLFQKAMVIKREINDQTGLLTSLNGAAKTETELGNFAAARNLLNEAYDLARLTKNVIERRNVLESLISLNKKLGDYQTAVAQYDELLLVKDSVLNSEKLVAIEDTKAKYETEKKEQQIALQQAQIAEQQAQNQRNLVLIAALGISVVLLLIIVLLVRSRARRKQEMLRQEADIKVREAQLDAAITSQEKERTRFAKDLHDGFGQMISILNLNLKSLETEKADRHDVFEKSANVLEDMYRELKSICFNLMPQTLIQHGLGHAVREFAQRINQTGKLHVAVDLFGLDQRLSDVQEISLYRITQEWVNNILKYSDASQIGISVTCDENEITLLVEDNGSGFDPEILKNGKGNGWRNMNSRANLIKGSLEIDSQTGIKGSALIVNAPIVVKSQQVLAEV